MSAQPQSRLAGLQMVDPQDSSQWTSARVPATAPAPLPGAHEPLEVAIAGAGRMWTLPEWNAETHGTSLLVLVGGRIVHEWYADDLGPRTRFLGASMTKSVLTLLVGVAIRSGDLTADSRVVDVVPDLRGTGYDGCAVRDVLTMTTGVDWVEDHRDPDSAVSRLLATFSTGSGGSRDLLREIPPGVPPGTRFAYNTADSQVLDWIRESATGVPFAEALQGFWASLGAETDAYVALDAPDGVALAGGGLAACARDWARAATQLTDRSVDQARLLDVAFVDEACTPPLPFLAPGRLPSSITTHAGFGWAWWPLDAAGRHVTADGSRGQFAYVDRDLDVVVVKTSAWPYDDWLVDRQLRDLSYLGLPAIARAAHEQHARDKEVTS